MQFISSGVKDTISFAENLSKGFRGGEVIALCGDLGAGKTHFSKGIAKGLGIKETVTSPTFTIMQSYPGGRLNLYHCDMYRVDDEKELYETGFYEALSDKKGVCVIEWAEKIKGALPPDTIYINIEINSKNKRTITVKDRT
jgi:tRNA threonylcarbamoyladenosine biosynthesis protein TsaE